MTRQSLTWLLATLVVVAGAACGAIDLGSNGGASDRDASVADDVAPAPEGGSDAADAEAGRDAGVADAPLAPPVYIKASNPQVGAHFTDVAIDGDTLVVGAPGEASGASGVGANQADRSAPGAGAAYVFRRVAGAWSQEAYLKPSVTEAGAAFGACVAVQGNTLVVGAFNESAGAAHAGAVYVFARSGTTWTEQAVLHASNARAEAVFGNAIALSGDTLVVGAPGETSSATGVNGNAADTSAPGAGAAYVFTRTGTAWSQTAYLKASNTRPQAQFGTSVAIEHDTLVVSALTESSKATGVNGDQADTTVPGAGAAYVFTRTGTAWSQQAYLKSSNRFATADQGGGFGIALALSGNTLAVGQYIEPSGTKGIGGNQTDTSAPNAGAAYVFTRTGVAWSQQTYLKPFNTRPLALFGYSVALEGDRLVVGAIQESSAAVGRNGDANDTSAPSAGAAYAFQRTAGTWAQTAYLKATNTRRDALFGYSVALSGGIIAVGSQLERSGAAGVNGDGTDTSAPSAGAVYVFP